MTTFANLKTYVEDQIADSGVAKGIAIQERSIDRALRRLAKEAEWSFYLREGRFNLMAPYTTGTVAISQDSPTLTLTGGTWPTTMSTVPWHIILDANSEVEYKVNSRDSGTQVTLTETWPFTAVSGGTYTAYRRTYDLPAKFRKLYLGHLESNWNLEWIPPVDWFGLLNDTTSYSGDPRFYSLYGDQFQVWPYSAAIKTIDFIYSSWPKLLADGGVSDGTSIDWPDNYLDLLYAALDYEACREWAGDNPRSVEQAAAMYTYELAKARAMDADRGHFLQDQFGVGGGGPTPSRWRGKQVTSS